MENQRGRVKWANGHFFPNRPRRRDIDIFHRRDQFFFVHHFLDRRPIHMRVRSNGKITAPQLGQREAVRVWTVGSQQQKKKLQCFALNSPRRTYPNERYMWVWHTNIWWWIAFSHLHWGDKLLFVTHSIREVPYSSHSCKKETGKNEM